MKSNSEHMMEKVCKDWVTKPLLGIQSLTWPLPLPADDICVEKGETEAAKLFPVDVQEVR